VRIEDYLQRRISNLQTGTVEPITEIPESNVLIYYTENHTKVALRPSGTEPKIKFYISVQTEFPEISGWKETEKRLDEKIRRIVTELGIDG
jgi:phosphoglucomutase